MVAKKMVFLGGGSLYFTRAISDIVIEKELDGSEIVIYDIDKEKAGLMANLGKRLMREAKTSFKIRSAGTLEDAVDGADFAISSIGGSGAEITRNVYSSYYHGADMSISAKYGIQQVVGDTCGPAGMMMGLRTIPVYLKICKELEKRCPNVIFFNHSNPMAVICRAMNKYTNINFYGICHGVQEGFGDIAGILGVSPEELQCTWIGTNHYYWFTRILHNGKDMYPELMKRMAKTSPDKNSAMTAKLSQIYGYKIVYPVDDHVIEFYPFSSQYQRQDDLPYNLAANAKHHGFDANKLMKKKEEPSKELRGEFLAKYQEILNKTTLSKKEGNSFSGEGLASLINAIAAGKRQTCIINIPNNGLIPNLPKTALVEVEGVTDFKGARGIYSGECPLHLKGILEKRFVWQEFVADAAVKGDRNLALQALLLDEMAIIPEKAELMLEELLNASKDLLPQFFK